MIVIKLKEKRKKKFIERKRKKTEKRTKLKKGRK
jgi:hypothetical protein